MQGFCESLIRRESLRTADAAAGKLRSFLLGAFQHHLVSLHRHATRERRGGGQVVISWDDATSQVEPALAHGVSPDVIYDRLWAKALLAQVMQRLHAEYAARGRDALLEKIEPFLFWGGDGESQNAIAAELGMSQAAIQQAVKRLRLRYRALLEDEVAQALDNQEALAQEMQDLLQILTQAG